MSFGSSQPRASSTRDRYRPDIPSQRGAVRPPSRASTDGDDEDPLNTLPLSAQALQARLEAARAEASQTPRGSASSEMLRQEPGAPTTEDTFSRASTVVPTRSITSLREASDALHLLAEFFATYDVPPMSQDVDEEDMYVEEVDLVSAALDRLQAIVAGSQWAEHLTAALPQVYAPQAQQQLFPPVGQTSNAAGFFIDSPGPNPDWDGGENPTVRGRVFRPPTPPWRTDQARPAPAEAAMDLDVAPGQAPAQTHNPGPAPPDPNRPFGAATRKKGEAKAKAPAAPAAPPKPHKGPEDRPTLLIAGKTPVHAQPAAPTVPFQ